MIDGHVLAASSRAVVDFRGVGDADALRFANHFWLGSLEASVLYAEYVASMVISIASGSLLAKKTYSKPWLLQLRSGAEGGSIAAPCVPRDPEPCTIS